MGLFGGSDDDEGESADEGMDESGDALIDDDDDLLDGGDDMAFGEMEDEDGGGGGAASAELENRMDELENEVGSLSSTVNTVKSENEQISESVDDMEENIRKLLEVYEMVTRGVNPFVNEDELGNAFEGGGGGAAGGGASLFGDDGGGEDEEALDEDVAGAEAEDFFDEDLGEDEFDEGMDEFDDGTDEFEDEADEFDDGMDEFDDGDDAGGDEGKSFEELKAEYDAGDAEWQGDETDTGETLESPDDGPAEMDNGEMGEGVGEGLGEALGDSQPDPGGMSDAEGLDEVVAEETELDGEAPDEAELNGGPPDEAELEEGAPDEGADTTADAPASGSSDGRRPHLEVLPDGYASDVVVMEWLEFLVDQGGVDGAARTIAYYESIGWLGEPAAEDLQTYLGGFGDPADLPDPEGIEARSPLSVQCHRTSLRYVSRLSSAATGMDVMDQLEEGGVAAGPEPDASPAPPDWLAGNGHDGAAPSQAAEATGGPATDGGTEPAGDDGQAPVWNHPSESGAVGPGDGHEPAPGGRATRAGGADEGPPSGGRRGVEQTETDAPAGGSSDDTPDQ